MNQKTGLRTVIVITGFMGTGKTSTGRALAGMLGLDFIDTDEEIETSTGLSIAEIFTTHGESRFRLLEEALCHKLKDRSGLVIATGGGTLLNENNYRLLSESGELFLLEASVEVLAKRIDGNTTRPMLDVGFEEDDPIEKRIEMILDRREPFYKKITNRVDTTELEAVETAARIAARLSLPCRRTDISLVPVDKDSASRMPLGRFGISKLEIGRGILSSLGARIKSLDIGTHMFLLMPKNLQEMYLAQIEASMNEASLPYSVITIKDGDAEKHMDQARVILDAIIDAGAKRDSVIIPIGGGVTGDIGGFVASMYMRGIPLVQVPTTLLAQVDSAIGGKVGVNHPLAKNIIGAFYQPHLIVMDPCTLRTLPLEEVSNGMAEVVKSALIGSQSFFEYLEDQIETDAETRLRDIGFLETCALEASGIKSALVNADPLEKDMRRMLNLGHTLGHALEASGHYAGLKHGQAVSVGIVAAFRIAADRGIIDGALLDRVVRLLEWCQLPTGVKKLDKKTLTRSMQLDKKFKKGKLHFVLPVSLGAADVVDDVTVEDIFSTMEKKR